MMVGMPKLTKQWKITIWVSAAVALAIALTIVILLIVGKLPHLGWRFFDTPKETVQTVPEAISTYTGLPITKEQSQQRALGVMIAGDLVTRPQSGLGIADIVVEMEAASSITRFLAIFQSEIPKEIGSVRSARNDYIDIAAGFDAVLVHWGGEKKALDRLASTDAAEIDQFANGDLFYRKLSVPAPHNGFTTDELMEEGLARYNYDRSPTFSAWQFEEPADISERARSGILEIIYGNPSFNVEYEYDAVTNKYLRSQGGVEHKDVITGETIAPTNVLVLRANHFTYDQIGGYLQIDIKSGGDCTLFNNGSEEDCVWEKGGEDDPITIKDKNGFPLALVKGQTYIQVVLPSAEVNWEPQQSSSTGSVTQ